MPDGFLFLILMIPFFGRLNFWSGMIVLAGLWIGEVSDGFLKSGRQLGLVGHRIPLVDNAILAEIIY